MERGGSWRYDDCCSPAHFSCSQAQRGERQGTRATQGLHRVHALLQVRCSCCCHPGRCRYRRCAGGSGAAGFEVDAVCWRLQGGSRVCSLPTMLLAHVSHGPAQDLTGPALLPAAHCAGTGGATRFYPHLLLLLQTVLLRLLLTVLLLLTSRKTPLVCLPAATGSPSAARSRRSLRRPTLSHTHEGGGGTAPTGGQRAAAAFGGRGSSSSGWQSAVGGTVLRQARHASPLGNEGTGARLAWKLPLRQAWASPRLRAGNAGSLHGTLHGLGEAGGCMGQPSCSVDNVRCRGSELLSFLLFLFAEYVTHYQFENNWPNESNPQSRANSTDDNR